VMDQKSKEKVKKTKKNNLHLIGLNKGHFSLYERHFVQKFSSRITL